MVFQPVITGRVWSEYLFDNDGALFAVLRLNELAGLKSAHSDNCQERIGHHLLTVC